MPSIPVETITTQVLLWAVTGLLGWVVGRLAAYSKREKKEDKAIKDGVCAILRAQMMTIQKDVKHQGGASNMDKVVMERLYVAYHALGQNGVGTKMYEDVRDAPLADE